MKIRNGFISNSSSTSFVIFATKKQIDEAFKKIDKKYRAWVKSTFIRPILIEKIKFESKEYLRCAGLYDYNQAPVDWTKDEDIEGVIDTVEQFFQDIGPISFLTKV